MCRSSSPLFGDLVFRRFSRDEFERRVRLSSAFRQEGMGSGGSDPTRSFDSYETVQGGRGKNAYQPPDVLVT